MDPVTMAIMFAISLLLSVLLAPKPNIENARKSNLGDFQVPRASEGDPLGMIWGTVKSKSPNTIWYGNLNTGAIKKKIKTSPFTSKKVITGYRYYLGLNLALAHGPGIKLSKIWAGTDLAWSSSPGISAGDFVINQPEIFGGDEKGGGLQGTVTFYDGSFTQGRDGYLSANVDPDVPAYVGVAHLVFKDFYIGTSESLDFFSFELSRFPANVYPMYSKIGEYDCNPMEILYDAMVEKWGRLGIDPALIDLPSWRICAETLYNEGNGMSLKVESNMTGSDFIQEILRQIEGLIYQDPATGKIFAKLLRQDYVVGDLPVFDESAVIEITNFAKSTWSATFNQARINFINRENNYAAGVAVAQDFANINYQGKVCNTDYSMNGIYLKDLANQVAVNKLRVLSVPLIKLDIVINRTANTLRPGSLFVLNWAAPDSFVLSGLVLRVLEIDLGALENGQIRISAIQDSFATSQVVFAPPAETEWQAPSTSPMPVLIRKAFEAPYYLAKLSSYDDILPEGMGGIYITARRPGSVSLGFLVDYTNDGGATEYITDAQLVYNGSGTLTSDYDATEGVDRHDTTGFSISSISGAENLINAASLAEVRDGSALVMIDDEIMLYVGYVQNLDGTITFDDVYRGLFDTVPADHEAGATVYFISSADGALEPPFLVGDTVSLKYLDQTPSGGLTIDEATGDTVAITGRANRPAPPNYLTLEGSRTPPPVAGATAIAAAWRPRNRKAADVVVYNDPADVAEAGTDYRVRWRIDAGAWSTLDVTDALATIDTTGLIGLLEVEVYSRRDGILSAAGESLTIELT
jgi:Putative phage tail protein